MRASVTFGTNVDPCACGNNLNRQKKSDREVRAKHDDFYLSYKAKFQDLRT